jgi:hypothetical protein
MLAQDESPAPGAVSGTSRKLLRLLRKRLRQLLRATLVLAIGLAFLAGALEIWRGVSLIRLPDVGDPYDVAAFRAVRIPEDRDAGFLLHQAQERVNRRVPNLSLAGRRLAPAYKWSAATPELRDWVTANRDALELFRDASERPDATVHPALNRDDRHFILYIGDLVLLAFFEASRLEERGEMAEAWNWYRAIFRVKLHVMRRGSIFHRWIADRNCSSLRTRITAWAADPRTNVLLIRRALDNILAGEPKSEWDAFSLKADYLDMMDELDKDWGPLQQGEEEDQIVRIGSERLPPALGWIPYAAKRYVWNEPERSRRVLRLAFANWLAHAQEKDPQYLKATVRATCQFEKRTATVSFYAVSPAGQSAARQLTPRVLAEWLVGTRDAKILLSDWTWPAIRGTERREHRALVVLLAGELYKRDHGVPPASDQMLVGPYLDQLPSDGSAELDDGSAPTIREVDATASAKEG